MATSWPRRLGTLEAEDAFRADWMRGLHREEVAWRHGFADVASVTRAAHRLRLPPRRGGVAAFTPEQAEAFRADWALGMPLAEMAALHGYTNVNSISRAARRLGLKPRRSTIALSGGDWVLDPARRVQVWVEEAA